APVVRYRAEVQRHRWCMAGPSNAQAWPTCDPALAATEEVTLVVQVDGKVRDRSTVPAGLSKPAASDAALASPRAKAALDGRDVDRVVVVPDRLVNIVTRRRS